MDPKNTIKNINLSKYFDEDHKKYALAIANYKISNLKKAIQLMDELILIDKEFQPQETLLVADALTGQDAANIAKSFGEAINITGSILTRIDGDSRGGAALSIKTITILALLLEQIRVWLFQF